ncbi:hypothetical protein [uncultured Rothia sp.]
MTGVVSETILGAFLIALRVKGGDPRRALSSCSRHAR